MGGGGYSEDITSKFDIWDHVADVMTKDDRLREVNPILDAIWKDDDGIIHIPFSKLIFSNPKYTIPSDDFALFMKFVEGGSREYPSDGSIPLDVVVEEAKIILDDIERIAYDPEHPLHDVAKNELERDGRLGMVRGALKIYKGKYTTRDWRRKRFTDDIDFWVFDKPLLEHVLRQNGWRKNPKTKEYEKHKEWLNYATKQRETCLMIASNDIDQRLDFGAGSHLEGTDLKDIFKKKIERGHDVDLSDIINIALYNDKIYGELTKEWMDTWITFKALANTRNTRVMSNFISLCRYGYGIADYLERVAQAIEKYAGLILNEKMYLDEHIIKVYEHSRNPLMRIGKISPQEARKKIINSLYDQARKKVLYASNLRHFVHDILELVNSKYRHVSVIFEIQGA
ncbi:MAG: hypothetical protein ACFFCS_06665 [Candidatus Hodarchaeota archaeon]